VRISQHVSHGESIQGMAVGGIKPFIVHWPTVQ
jgi:hypothetical protein